MRALYDQDQPPAPSHGQLRQVKLHELALAYAYSLYDLTESLAGAIASDLERQLPPASGEAASVAGGLRRFLADAVQAVMAEQTTDAASPFVRAACRTYAECAGRTGAAPDASAGGRDIRGTGSIAYESFAADLAARVCPAGSRDELRRIAGVVQDAAMRGVGRLLALADLRGVEAVCWELLTEIYHCDGARFVIDARRAADAQDVIHRYGAVHRSRRAEARAAAELPEDKATIKRALKIALTVCLLGREPHEDAAAVLMEGYADLGLFLEPASGLAARPRLAGGVQGMETVPLAAAGARRSDGSARTGPAGEARRELREEIEFFRRTIEQLRG